MALEDDVQALARHPTLAALEPEALRLLASSAETWSLRQGEVLFRRNDASDGGYFILSGSIAIDAGGQGQAVRTLHQGMLIGDMALIAKTRRPVTATASEPSSVLKITRVLFHRVLNQYPRSGQRLHKALSERLQTFTQDLDGVRQRAFEAED